MSVANLTSMQYWVTYLQIIQEAVWPGGVLPAEPWPLRTPLERDHSRQQALLGLMGVVPGTTSTPTPLYTDTSTHSDSDRPGLTVALSAPRRGEVWSSSEPLPLLSGRPGVGAAWL